MSPSDETIWSIAQEIGNSERHFNQLQHQYRALASAWTLAMFAGIQYLLSNWGALPLPSGVLLALIGLAGAIGMTQLWSLDLRVYHQLLEAYFVEGLKLEADHPWLPQIRTRMLATQETRASGVLSRVVWFYIVGNSIALLIATAGAVLAVIALPGVGVPGTLGVACLGALIALFWGREIRRQTRSPLLQAWSAHAVSNRYGRP